MFNILLNNDIFFCQLMQSFIINSTPGKIDNSVNKKYYNCNDHKNYKADNTPANKKMKTLILPFIDYNNLQVNSSLYYSLISNKVKDNLGIDFSHNYDIILRYMVFQGVFKSRNFHKKESTMNNLEAN